MRHLKFLFLYSMWALLMLSAPASAQTPAIEAWCYYSSAPFQTDASGKAGLASDLVEYLNQQLAGKLKLKLIFLPRVRLDQRLASAERGLVLFAPSMIFGGVDGKQFLWSKALLDDSQTFVSRVDTPFEYKGPSSLTGLRFLAMRGHNFPLLQKELDRGDIRIDYVDNESSLLRMLQARRADVITIPNSVFQYFAMTDPQLTEGLHISTNKLQIFSRHLMLHKGLSAESELLKPILLKMHKDPNWITTLKKYGLAPSQ